ncbi:hypothetical protein QO058_26420 [Bosea vestrisii]|nr:hypothetical protein [Bosea vestrisii]WID96223.1 hypothetical protein QO058_26420 [Bosea vestrisii]
MEDPAICDLVEQPEPWPQHQPVMRQPMLDTEPLPFRNYTVHHPLAGRPTIEFDMAGLADKLIEVYIGIVRHRVNLTDE